MVSYNTGFKSGGFNPGVPADPAYAPEVLSAYEMGLKVDLLDNRLRLKLGRCTTTTTRIFKSPIMCWVNRLLQWGRGEGSMDWIRTWNSWSARLDADGGRVVDPRSVRGFSERHHRHSNSHRRRGHYLPGRPAATAFP